MVKKLTLVALALLGLLSRPALAEGRSLRERIKSVSNVLYMKSGRVELLFPWASLSLNDAFYQKFGGGLGLAYHFTEGLSAGLYGIYHVNMDLNNASLFGGNADKVKEVFAGKRSYGGGLDLAWAPLYGKVSLAGDWLIHFDTYLVGGLALVGSEQVNEDTNVGFAGSFGLGFRLFFSRTFALRIELRDNIVFNDLVTFSNQEKEDVQHQLVCNLGLSIFLGQGDKED